MARKLHLPVLAPLKTVFAAGHLDCSQETEACHWSFIPFIPTSFPAPSDLMAAVRDEGCEDALVSPAPDLHPSAITFSLAPTTAATARERDLAGC